MLGGWWTQSMRGWNPPVYLETVLSPKVTTRSTKKRALCWGRWWGRKEQTPVHLQDTPQSQRPELKPAQQSLSSQHQLQMIETALKVGNQPQLTQGAWFVRRRHHHQQQNKKWKQGKKKVAALKVEVHQLCIFRISSWCLRISLYENTTSRFLKFACITCFLQNTQLFFL